MTSLPKTAIKRMSRALPKGMLPLARKLVKKTLRRERPLWTMLPLSVPLSLHIDPSNSCNFRCSFCPTGRRDLLAEVKRPQGLMAPELFFRIIDQVHAMTRTHRRKIKKLHLYKDGEPLLNPHFFALAAYAKSKGVADEVSTTTNGSLLNESVIDKLIDCRIDSVRISIEQVTDAGYARITGTRARYDAIRENVARLFHAKKTRRSGLRIIAKITDCGLSADEKATFIRDFSPIADEVRIDTLMGWSASDRADFTLGHHVDTGMDGSSPIVDRECCPEPFSSLAINFDGSVSVCCVDWSHGTIVGDARHQDLESIWNGERLRAFRLKHLTGRRQEIPVCAHCHYLKGKHPLTDLSGKKAEVLRRMNLGSATTKGASKSS
jgi:radical SAM protein with 4Fe4S-binding SPASM domain